MEEHKIDLLRIRSEIHISSLLEKLGYRPVKQSGGELFYLSMLRENDSSPSFCVNEKMDLWYDHGMGKGGNIIDLALLLWPLIGFKGAMEKLLESSNGLDADYFRPAEPKQLEMDLKSPSYQILEDRAIGGNARISSYLHKRGIFDVAKPFLRELYYRVKTSSGEQRQMFAAAWRNEHSGWEVRNDQFKGCLGRKSMSFMSSPDSGSLAVFEGMMDFLSWRLENPLSKQNILILNSVAMLAQAMTRAQSYEQVSIYFDHDTSGRKASEAFLQRVPQSKDHSGVYQGFADYNEKIQFNQQHFKSALKR